ncbi:hypothetical protein SZ54_4867 [Rhizobium sp. UR51a]|nr:hypothetical protein SZ54_4867 [Rhizobium sp. UR51a]
MKAGLLISFEVAQTNSVPGSNLLNSGLFLYLDWGICR